MGGKKAVARRWRKRAMPVARKAFNIIPNYRHQMAFARSGAMRSGGQRFAAAVRIILIMLLAAERRGNTNPLKFILFYYCLERVY